MPLLQDDINKVIKKLQMAKCFNSELSNEINHYIQNYNDAFISVLKNIREYKRYYNHSRLQS